MGKLHVIQGKEYKVKDGDTLESIASANGLSWQKLAKFNWGIDNADAVNLKLRDKIGSRKKSPDGKKFILSKDDDPGVIYIPEKPTTPKTFATDVIHALIVKPPKQKIFNTSKCMVTFRPDPGWKGEYGFDWMRNGDWGNLNNYLNGSILDGGYKSSTATGMTAAEALAALKREFEPLATFLSTTPEYYVPYLNIFPNGLPIVTGESISPTSTFKLKMTIIVEGQDADSLRINLPVQENKDGTEKPYFSLKSGNLELTKTVGRHELTIELQCIEQFSDKQEITVVAVTRETDGTYKEYIAGKILVFPNSKHKQKEVKLVFIKVVTDVLDTGLKKTGVYDPGETRNLINALFQTLSIPDIEIATGMIDVSNDPEFKIMVDAAGHENIGKHCENFSPTVRGLRADESLHRAFKDKFLRRDNKKYKRDFLVFAVGDRTPSDLNHILCGFAEDIGVKSVILFDRLFYDKCTLNHEILHGLGLRHFFKESPVKKASKYTFSRGVTDNVMDYTAVKDTGLYTMHWQWKLVNPS